MRAHLLLCSHINTDDALVVYHLCPIYDTALCHTKLNMEIYVLHKIQQPSQIREHPFIYSKFYSKCSYQEGLKQMKALQEEKHEEENAAEKQLESKNKDEESGRNLKTSR